MQELNTQNEEAIISILLDEDTLSEVNVEKLFNHLPDKMFINNCLRKIYQIIKEVYHSEDKVLFGTNHFREKVKLMAFMEIDESELYLNDIKNYWTPKSTVFNFVKKIQDEYFHEQFKLATTQEEFESIIEEKQKYCIQDSMKPISEDANEILEQYDRVQKTCLKTTYPSLDDCIGSLQGGDMVVLAAATGCGKTLVMLNIAKALAKQGHKVDIFSLEMPKIQLQQRIICSEACVDASKFRDFSLSDEDRQRFNDYANNQFKRMPINIFNKQSVSIDELKNIEMKSDSEIVFIDYLGLIEGDKRMSSYERYSEISRRIKLTAMQTNKPIIALHQLNRNFQDRDDKKPKVSDLRDSGKIEQDADMIWLLYRPYMWSKDVREKESIILSVAKNRHGKNNVDIQFSFNAQYQQLLESVINMKV